MMSALLALTGLHPLRGLPRSSAQRPFKPSGRKPLRPAQIPLETIRRVKRKRVNLRWVGTRRPDGTWVLEDRRNVRPKPARKSVAEMQRDYRNRF